MNLVITKDLSRLGRDYIMTGHYMERYFPEHGVRYISLLDGIDTGVDSTANDITPFRAIMNDMYAKDISKKITSVKRDKQRKGLFIGGKPVFGYKMHPSEKNKIVIDEGAAPVVRRIFNWALSGMSCRQIACRLNQEGVPTPAIYAGLTVAKPGPYAGLWSGEQISRMLQNETYIGNMVQGRRRKINYKSKKFLRMDPKDWVVVAGTHDPIIDPTAFDQVQLLLNSRKHTRTRTYDFLLKGLIFCHECGHPLAVLNRKKPDGKDCLYFVCRTYQRFTKARVCTSHTIQEAAVNQAVMNAIQEACKEYLRSEILLPIAEQEVAMVKGGETDQLDLRRIEARIKNLERHLDKVYGDLLCGLLDDRDFKRIYGTVKAERRALEEKLKCAGGREDASPQGVDLPEQLVERFLETAPFNRELLVRLVQRVELTSDRQLILRFRFPKEGPLVNVNGTGAVSVDGK